VRFCSSFKYLLATVVAIVSCSLMTCTKLAGAQNIVPGHIVIRVQPGVDINRLASDYNTKIIDHASGTDLYTFAVPVTTTETAFAATVGGDARVVYAEPDHYAVSPEVSGEPFHFAFDLSTRPPTFANSASYVQINIAALSPPGRVKAPPPLATGAGIVVAVLDTGVTFTHPDLRFHLLPGFNAVHPGQPPVDVADGIVNYEVGHGTMVAGIIVRLAPQALVMPVRVLNGDGSGTMFDVVKGVRYATTHGARIINMSFGSSIKSSALNDALDEAELAGIILVASAGNDNTNQVNPPTVSRGTISVAALESNNQKSPYSNFGSFVRVSAPGSNIRSTYANGGYASWSGTSFAAPFVSAEAALILSMRPALTSEQVKTFIRNTAHSVDSVNPAYRGQLGNGVIDMDAAVKAAKQ
jgi:subtilisin family serine protease